MPVTTRSRRRNTVTDESSQCRPTRSSSQSRTVPAACQTSEPVAVESVDETIAVRVSGLEASLNSVRRDLGAILTTLEGCRGNVSVAEPVNSQLVIPASTPMLPRDSVSLPIFDGSDVGWEEFRAMFDTLATIHGWNRTQKASKLLCSLRGRALEVIVTMSMEERYNPESILNALENRFGVQDSRQLFIARFTQRVQSPDEDIARFWEDIQRLGSRAYGNLPPETQNVLLNKQFCEGIRNRRVREHLFLNSPNDLRESLRLALAFEAACARAGGSSNEVPRDSDVPCPRPILPNSQRSELRSKGSSNGRGITCWSCGATGHVQARCPKAGN